MSAIKSDKNSMNNHQHPVTDARQELALQHGSAPTHTHTHTGAQVFLVVAYTFARSRTVFPANSARHGQAQKRTHSCSPEAGLKCVHTRAQKNLTQWHYYPLAWDAKMSTGKQRLCVSRGRACWRVICLKLTPPTLPQWQQVSSHGPDLCELRMLLSTLGTKLFITVTLHTQSHCKAPVMEGFFHVINNLIAVITILGYRQKAEWIKRGTHWCK